MLTDWERALFERVGSGNLTGPPAQVDLEVDGGEVLDFGGGAEFRVFKWFARRAEVRDFYAGSPAFNIPTPGGQHNLVAGEGFVLKLGSSED